MSLKQNEIEEPEGEHPPLPGADKNKINEVLEKFQDRLESGASESLVKDMRGWILEHPLNEHAFALLGEAIEKTGNIGESVIAMERAMQLKAISESRRLTEATSQLANLRKFHQFQDRVLNLQDYSFMDLLVRETLLGKIVCGRSLDGGAFLRALVVPKKDGLAGWEKEVNILSELTEKGCQTAPILFSQGEVPLTELKEHLEGDSDPLEISANDDISVPYVIEEYLTSIRGYRFSDLALALFEQQALGIYHANLNPSKIYYDPVQGLCRLRSFDQAVRLDETEQKLLPRDYVKWMNEYHAELTGDKNSHFLQYYRSVDLERDFWCYFRQGSLDLAWTAVFQNQITTASPKRIYHSHPGQTTHIVGERGLAGRKQALEKIFFRDGEVVADVGCASGLLCEWLHDKGCQVTGIDMDRKLTRGNRILANISGRSIEYHGLDVEHERLPGEYDTLILFSTLHHFLWPKLTVKRLLNHCRERILIETPLKSHGAKWIGKRLEWAPKFEFETLEQLITAMEQLFEGFSFTRDYGQVDGSRYLLEWRRGGKR